MDHHTRTEEVPVTGWTLHWPRCTCGWDGDIVRTHRYATDQVTEHLADEHPTTEAEQPTLFDA